MSQFVKTIADPRFPYRKARLWIAALLLALVAVGVVPGSMAAAQTSGQPGEGQVTDVEKALRQRTTEFYTLLQTSQTAKAAEYVMKDGRDRFRAEPNGRFLAFRIVSVDMQPDKRNATVVVEMTVMSPYMGGMMPVQRKLHWQIEDGEWRLEMPNSTAAGLNSAMAMGNGDEQSKAKSEDLVFKGHSFGLGVMKPGEHKEIRFPFKNTSSHVVKIAQIETGCDCLKVKTQKMEYKPGESGDVVLDFDSTGYEFEYSQTVVVRTDPGDIPSYLLVHGTVVSQEIVDSQNRARSEFPTQSPPPSDPPPAAPVYHRQQ